MHFGPRSAAAMIVVCVCACIKVRGSRLFRRRADSSEPMYSRFVKMINVMTLKIEPERNSRLDNSEPHCQP